VRGAGLRPGVHPEVGPESVLSATSEDEAAESSALQEVRAAASSAEGAVGDADGVDGNGEVRSLL
jgi:hypothetical protein